MKDPREPRPTCPRCRRPLRVCYCAALTTIETATRIVILQHPRERDVAIGTARMAALCLPRASVHVGVRWEGSDVLDAIARDTTRRAVLLYPGPGAGDVLADPPRGPTTLVVIDGTWAQAKTIVRENPALAALPRYAFTPPEPSEYRIRKEPAAACVSTLEALVHALGAIEGDPQRFRDLLRPFRAMVDAQIAARADAGRARFCRPREHVRRDGPLDVLRRRFADVVCVAAEANLVQGGGANAEELVHWVARRAATGETFDAVARPDLPLGARTTLHIRVGEDRLRAGGSRAELVEAFARWLRPGDVVCSWGPYAPRLFAQSGGALPGARVDARTVARRLAGGTTGTLVAYASRFGRGAAESVPEGRAGETVAALVRIVRAWSAGPSFDESVERAVWRLSSDPT